MMLLMFHLLDIQKGKKVPCKGHEFKTQTNKQQSRHTCDEGGENKQGT
jgi:hypothetical protein